MAMVSALGRFLPFMASFCIHMLASLTRLEINFESANFFVAASLCHQCFADTLLCQALPLTDKSVKGNSIKKMNNVAANTV